MCHDILNYNGAKVIVYVKYSKRLFLKLSLALLHPQLLYRVRKRRFDGPEAYGDKYDVALPEIAIPMDFPSRGVSPMLLS